jgi:hypothetical protein
MKKTPKMIILSLVLACMLPFCTVNAQTGQIFKQGDIVMSAGIGLGATYGTYWGSYYNTSVPPIFLSGDYCLREDLGPGNLGVGGILAYSAYKYKPSPDWGYKYTTFYIGVRGSYHFTELVDKLDLYGAITLGGKIVSDKGYGDYSYYAYSVNSSSALAELVAGIRYYFTDNIGVMSELGYGIAWLKLGLSVKF